MNRPMSVRSASSTDVVKGLLAEPRRRNILEWLGEQGSARVRDLSVASNVDLVAGSTGTKFFNRLGGLERINTSIIDDGNSDSDPREFQLRGIDLLIAT